MQYIDSITFLALETKKESLISKTEKVLINDSLIFLLNKTNHKIVTFDLYGNFKYAIDYYGRGVGEYLELISFTIDSSFVYTVDNYTNSLNKFDINNGTFVERIELKMVPDDIAYLSKGNILVARTPDERLLKQSPHKVSVIDSIGNIKFVFEDINSSDCINFHRNIYLTEGHEYIVYNHILSDIITIYDKNNPINRKRYYIDFGSRKIPSKRINNSEGRDRFYFLWETPLLVNNYLIADVNIDEYVHWAFIDLNKEKCIIEKMNNDGIIYGTPKGIYKNSMVLLMDFDDDISEKRLNVIFNGDKSLITHYREGNPVLAFYHFKN